MMNKIEKLIKELCPEGIEWKTLGDSCEIKTGKGITKNDGSDSGLYPIISGGKEPMGYYDKYNRHEKTVTISRVGANAGYVSFIDVKFYLNDKCFSILPTEDYREIIKNKFLFYFLKEKESSITELQSEGGVPTINTTKISRLLIPIPPLPIQQEIVNILDKFTTLEAELEAELEARSRQYDFYRNQLLSFDEDNVDWKTLEEVCEKTENIKWKESACVEYQYIDLSSVDRETNTILETQIINADNAPSRAQQIVQNEDVIFGTTRPTLRRYCFIKSEYDGQICSTGFCVLRANKNVIMPLYLFFMLTTSDFCNYVENNQEGAGYPAISNSKVKKYKIPVPPLAEQERIVAILDKFDKLVNDISEGLPAEINARRKQYEYYREKLLSFKNVNS